MKTFEVVVKNSILGDSSRIMSMKELEHYNVCALECARLADVDGKPHTIGMWTVSQHGNKEDER